MAERPDSVTQAPDVPDSEIDCICPLRGVLNILSRRHAVQLVCVVDEIGPTRYNDIEAAFGEASSSTLSTRLDELVEVGILHREQFAEIPPRVEYEPTEQGELLREQLDSLIEWAEGLDEDMIRENQQ